MMGLMSGKEEDLTWNIVEVHLKPKIESQL
jgi:hypothetical protein